MAPDGQKEQPNFALKLPMRTTILKKMGPASKAKPETILVKHETAKLVQQTRAGTISCSETVDLIATSRRIILPELIKHSLCSEVLDRRQLPDIISAVLFKIPELNTLISDTETKTETENDIDFDDTADNDDTEDEDIPEAKNEGMVLHYLATAVAVVMGRYEKESAVDIVADFVNLQRDLLVVVCNETRRRLQQRTHGTDAESVNQAGGGPDVVQQHCAYVLGLACNIVPLSAEYLAAKLHIDGARRHYYVRTVVSGSLKLALRIVAAVLTHGLSEAGLGQITSAVAAPSSDAVGKAIADISTNQKRLDLRRLSGDQRALNMEVQVARINKMPNWQLVDLYAIGRRYMTSVGEGNADLELSALQNKQEAVAKKFRPSPIPKTIGKFMDRFGRASEQRMASITGNARKKLQSASSKQKKSKDFVLGCVQRDGQALQYANKQLLRDPEIIEKALRSEHDIFKRLTELQSLKREFKYPQSPFIHADPSLQNDRKRLLGWIKLDPRVFDCVRIDLRTELQFQLDALRATPKEIALRATPDMWANRDFAMAAVKLEGILNYQFVAKALRDSPEFSLNCCREQSDVILDERLYANRQFVLDALKANPDVINWLGTEYVHDVDFLCAALAANNECYSALCEVPEGEELRYWVTALMKVTSGGAFKDLPKEARNDPLYAQPALDVDPLLLQHAGPDIQSNHDLALSAVIRAPAALQYVSPTLIEHPDFKDKLHPQSSANDDQAENRVDDEVPDHHIAALPLVN